MNKEELKTTPLIKLADRLHQIDEEQKRLNEEFDDIIYELWDRFPNLKESKEIQPKVLRKEVK